MTKTYAFLIGLIFSFNFGLSQETEEEASNVIVNWNVGETKTISQTDSTVIYNNDTLLMSTGINTNFKIKIMSLKDTVYEVLFKQINIDNNVTVESEMMDASPIQKMMQKLMVNLQKEMAGFEYTFLVNKNTALAYEIKNERKMKQKIEELVVIVLNDYLDLSKVEIDETKKKEVQLKIKEYMNEQMPAAFQTMLNSFNYIFQAYSFPFILDETYTTEIEVYSIDQINHSDEDTRAKLIVNSSANESELNIDYKYIYDKRNTYQTYVVDQGNGDKIPFEEFEMNERVYSSFNMNNSWIKHSTSFISVKMGQVLVNKTSNVTIK